MIAAHEPVGKIVGIGTGVTSLKVGDRVGVSWAQKGCGRCSSVSAKGRTTAPESQTWMDFVAALRINARVGLEGLLGTPP
jgi:D-arabinose 1-dehydrogenase-like Zn-dependent alcohol dehydrogenase